MYRRYQWLPLTAAVVGSTRKVSECFAGVVFSVCVISERVQRLDMDIYRCRRRPTRSRTRSRAQSRTDPANTCPTSSSHSDKQTGVLRSIDLNNHQMPQMILSEQVCCLFNENRTCNFFHSFQVRTVLRFNFSRTYSRPIYVSGQVNIISRCRYDLNGRYIGL